MNSFSPEPRPPVLQLVGQHSEASYFRYAGLLETSLLVSMFFHMSRTLGLHSWDIDDTFKQHLWFEGRHLFGYTLNNGMPTPVSCSAYEL